MSRSRKKKSVLQHILEKLKVRKLIHQMSGCKLIRKQKTCFEVGVKCIDTVLNLLGFMFLGNRYWCIQKQLSISKTTYTIPCVHTHACKPVWKGMRSHSHKPACAILKINKWYAWFSVLRGWGILPTSWKFAHPPT